MSTAWPSLKANVLLAALKRNGWKIVKITGSHKHMRHFDGRTHVFTFHENVEIGSKMVAQTAKRTGLLREDL